MPRQSPSTSKQDYETPVEVLEACKARFGGLAVDLACRRDNAKAPLGLYHGEVDSLRVPWAEHFRNRIMWLNPPFKQIAPWASKCREEGARLERGLILMLTPASVGANWFVDHVHDHALVLPLCPRITFVGATDAFPKDCMISVFGRGIAKASPRSIGCRILDALTPSRRLRAGFHPWRWDIT